ncbi:uncharacterized protein LOC143575714 [Bidens hawaiensis]|uniref:uncharacterized protein LOC143575714 n=1 Tax=Bidens hawaiensis TaxID=980011 RepID=UPI00404B4678
MADSNSSVLLNLSIASLNPFYLHPSDHPGIILVSKIFDGTGFDAWKRAMMIALSAKTSSFDNTSTISVNELPLAIWQPCNDMVILWILNTLTRDISDSVLYAEIAQIIWNELNTRYDRSGKWC